MKLSGNSGSSGYNWESGMSTSESHPSFKQEEINTGDFTQPIAREGEEQFGIIKRHRSGMSAGEIDFGARTITHLSKRDQQAAVDMAYCLYKIWCDQTGLSFKDKGVAYVCYGSDSK